MVHVFSENTDHVSAQADRSLRYLHVVNLTKSHIMGAQGLDVQAHLGFDLAVPAVLLILSHSDSGTLLP